NGRPAEWCELDLGILQLRVIDLCRPALGRCDGPSPDFVLGERADGTEVLFEPAISVRVDLCPSCFPTPGSVLSENLSDRIGVVGPELDLGINRSAGREDADRLSSVFARSLLQPVDPADRGHVLPDNLARILIASG